MSTLSLPSAGPLSRRTFLGCTAAVAGGTAAAGVALRIPSALATEAAADGPPGLAARLLPRPDGRVAILLARRSGGSFAALGSERVLRLSAALPPLERLRIAASTARDMLRIAAAHAWDADPADIDLDQGRIRHAASGRQAGYVLWVDVV